MATLYTVLAAVQEQVAAATTGLVSAAADTNGQTLNVATGIGWPSEKTLQNSVRKVPPTAIVTVFDRGLASDTTRWLPQEVGRVVVPASLTATLAAVGGGGAPTTDDFGNPITDDVGSPIYGDATYTASTSFLPPGGQMAVTLAGPSVAGDAVAVLLTAQVGMTQGTVAIVAQAEAMTEVAVNLASLLSVDPDIAQMVSVQTNGSTVVMTSLMTTPIRVVCNVGNGGNRTMEVGRRSRGIQIALWTRTEDDRITVGDAIDVLIAQLEADFGLVFPDGTMGRLCYAGDHQMNDATLSDIYRRDFLVSVDYPITTTDRLYAVLAPIGRNTTF